MGSTVEGGGGGKLCLNSYWGLFSYFSGEKFCYVGCFPMGNSSIRK